MDPRPVTLLDTSDKELLAIFDELSSTPNLMHPAALALALTCTRLHNLYRFDYVTGFDCRLVHPFSQQRPLLSFESGGASRIFLRLPRLATVTLFLKNWKAIRHLDLPLPHTITHFSLCEHIPTPRLSHPDHVSPRERELARSTALAGALPSALPRFVPHQFTYSERHLPAFAPALPALRHLSIHNCDVDFSAPTLADIASLTSLHSLSLHTCDATATLLADTLARIPHLLDLDLVNFNFDASLVEALPRTLHRLRLHDDATVFHGHLQNTRVGDICALPNLRHLDISGCPYLSEWSVLLPAADRLESLTLAHCPLYVSCERTCKDTLSSMKNLRRLTLKDTCDDYDQVLYAAAMLPKLHALSLASDEVEYEHGCGCQVSKDAIVALANGVVRRTLTSLTLDLTATDGLGYVLRELCKTLFAPAPGLPNVQLQCDF